jgi:aminopeptidase
MAGVPPEAVTEQRRISWDYFGPVAGQLVAGATNWTIAPAPSAGWADSVFGDWPPAQRLDRLWEVVFAALRVTAADPEAAWRVHLRSLQAECDRCNREKVVRIRLVGAGTDLTLSLPPEHVWCSAQRRTKGGISFVANLPTEEIFTVPDKRSARGTVRVTRPISHGGALIEGIELQFAEGRVVRAHASHGEELLHQLLQTDDGAARLGEVAVVPGRPVWAEDHDTRHYCHALLDENRSSHVALGQSYGFCVSAPCPAALNQSLIHVDLSLDARLATPESA